MSGMYITEVIPLPPTSLSLDIGGRRASALIPVVGVQWLEAEKILQEGLGLSSFF